MIKSSKAEHEQGRDGEKLPAATPFTGPEVEAPLSVQDVEIAGYIAEMLIPLRHLAISADTEFLSYLIEMAIEEAQLQSDKKN